MKKKIIHIIGWGITALLLYLVLSKINFTTLLGELKTIDLSFLIFAVGVNFVVICIKALRFKWLIKIGEGLSFKKVLNATIIGFAANNVFPARGGELVRIHLLSESGKRSKVSLMGVTFLEKLFDALGIVIMFPLLLLMPSKPTWLNKSIIIVSSFIVIFIVLSYMLRLFNRYEFIKKVTDGLKALHNKKDFFSNLLITIPSSLLQIITLALVQESFGIHLPLWISTLAFITVNIAITIPSAPSHLGTMEFALLLVYSSFGIKNETALNIALMYHAVHFFPVIALGAICYFGHSTHFTKTSFKGTTF